MLRLRDVRRVSRLVIATVSILLAGGALELVLRASDYHYSPVKIGANIKDDWREEHAFHDRHLVYDPVLIWRPWSGQFSPFNPQGFRGAPVDVAKHPGEFRIFALGDSNTFGWDVDEGANWPAQLQRLFAGSHPGTQVINAGVWGYTSFQGRNRFQELLAYSPDLVLVSFGANDAHQVRVPDSEYVQRHDRIERLTRATKRLRLAQLAVDVWDKVEVATGATGALVPRVSLTEYLTYLRDIVRTGRARGVRVVLLTRPYMGTSTDPASWKSHAPAYNEATRDVAREEHAPVIDVYAAFRDHPEYFDDESHFGVEGHHLAAELIHKELASLVAP